MNNPHHCAKTTFHSREVMVHRVLVDKHPVNRVANDFAISLLFATNCLQMAQTLYIRWNICTVHSFQQANFNPS